ncbi:MAG: dihydrodipicolinate synthase family protein [Anaerolineae bacterium]|nr:dihydrodipicolinate synthase family protein [Anaerolineae bacterium]
MALDSLTGIVTVLNTPFTADDRVDLESLSAHVAYALEAGVAGFLVPALASEVAKLTEAEREALVRQVVTDVAGRVPVIGGASAETRENRVRLATRWIEVGCAGVLVNLPYVDDAQYEADVRALAALNPGFLMLQDWDFGGYGLPVPLIARLFAEIDALQSLKIEVVPAGVKYTEVHHATGGRLHLAGGWAVSQMIEALDRGVHAMMPTALHRVYIQIDRLYRGGDREAAVALFQQLLPVLAFSNQHLDISVHFFKRLLHRQGLYATARVREPILPFDTYHTRIADELIERVIALEDRLGTSAPVSGRGGRDGSLSE